MPITVTLRESTTFKPGNAYGATSNNISKSKLSNPSSKLCVKSGKIYRKIQNMLYLSSSTYSSSVTHYERGTGGSINDASIPAGYYLICNNSFSGVMYIHGGSGNYRYELSLISSWNVVETIYSYSYNNVSYMIVSIQPSSSRDYVKCAFTVVWSGVSSSTSYSSGQTITDGSIWNDVSGGGFYLGTELKYTPDNLTADYYIETTTS